jgi:hypothetical protein
MKHMLGDENIPQTQEAVGQGAAPATEALQNYRCFGRLRRNRKMPFWEAKMCCENRFVRHGYCYQLLPQAPGVAAVRGSPKSKRLQDSKHPEKLHH